MWKVSRTRPQEWRWAGGNGPWPGAIYTASLKMIYSLCFIPGQSSDCLLLQCFLEFNSFSWKTVKPWVSRGFVYMNYMCLYMWFYGSNLCPNILVFATNRAACLTHNLKTILCLKYLLLWIPNVNYFVYIDSQ